MRLYSIRFFTHRNKSLVTNYLLTWSLSQYILFISPQFKHSKVLSMLSPSLHGCNIKCSYSRLGGYKTRGRGVLHFLHVVICPPVDLVMWFSVSQVNIKMVVD